MNPDIKRSAILKRVRRRLERERDEHVTDIGAVSWLVRECDEEIALLDELIAPVPTLSVEGPIEGWPGWPCRAPHCDPRVLHLPEECEFCAAATALQEERERLQVSNSGHANRRWPCPADVERGADSYHQWGGNRPTKSRAE